MLQWVCTLVQDQSVVQALSSAKSPSEVMAILAPLIEHT
jgi:mannitol/fructose-specific phosphotransferase system IIA component (Ntr-type)